MAIFEYSDYKRFLKDLIAALPKGGRGEARRISELLRINSVAVSQVMSGNRHFTPEQALSIAAHYALSESSTEYFVTLVNQARSGTKALESYYQRKLSLLRQQNLEPKNRVVKHRVISDEEKGIFYSNWFYSGIRLLTSIPGYQDMESISSYFRLSRAKVADAVEFLLSSGLCVQDEKGKITMGPSATFLSGSHRMVNNLRRNWRLKAIEKIVEPDPSDIFYSSPFSLSKDDAEHIRQELLKLIEACSKRVADSPSEELRCLNVDFFSF